jgi:hypothetical protein
MVRYSAAANTLASIVWSAAIYRRFQAEDADHKKSGDKSPHSKLGSLVSCLAYLLSLAHES